MPQLINYQNELPGLLKSSTVWKVLRFGGLVRVEQKRGSNLPLGPALTRRENLETAVYG